MAYDPFIVLLFIGFLATIVRATIQAMIEKK